jgi:NADH-quinone oxidoreductase subunit F
MADERILLLKNIRTPGYTGDLKAYQAAGGYTALPKALAMKPGELVDLVKASGLRGRGGAGFPTGLKWSFMAKNTGKPSYLICNADESEPGTFKDHLLMMRDPHQFLEGMIIGCQALDCHHGYIYVRGESQYAIRTLQAAIDEAYKAKLLGKSIMGKGGMGNGFALDMTIHPGAGAYICGEETALLDSLEGKRGQPRFKPPFPAVAGYDGAPTSVNNVETLTCLPWIVNNGADAFKAIGTPNNSGTHLVSISGHVAKPGVYEIEMGVPLRTIIESFAGGVRGGKKLKAVIPGGCSAPVLRADEVDVPYDFDSLAKAGTMMGSSAVMVFDEDTDMVEVAYRTIKFFNHESCGQCTPCREGGTWLERILTRICDGHGTPSDLDLLIEVGTSICPGNFPHAASSKLGIEAVPFPYKMTTICFVGPSAYAPVNSALTLFREEFEAKITKRNTIPVTASH